MHVLVYETVFSESYSCNKKTICVFKLFSTKMNYRVHCITTVR